MENMAEKLAKTLKDIIDGAAHPEIAVRRVMVDLKPIRAVLKEYEKVKGGK